MLEDGEIGDDGGVVKAQSAIQTARCSHSAHLDRTIMRYREHFVVRRRIQPLPHSQLVCRMQIGGNGSCELVRQIGRGLLPTENALESRDEKYLLTTGRSASSILLQSTHAESCERAK